MSMNFIKIIFSVCVCTALFGCKPAKLSGDKSGQLLVADFNSGQNVSNIGSKFGAWDKDPADATQTCQISFSDVEKVGKIGQSLIVRYDVDSDNAAYNGVWMQLNQTDVTKYKKLVFYVKGDAKEGFTSAFKVELKSTVNAGKFIVSGVTDVWQKIEIPFTSFEGLLPADVMLKELTIVFDDMTSNPKEGVIYIDSIYFE